MIRIDLTAEYRPSAGSTGIHVDRATASWNGQIFCAVSRWGASMALARILMGVGCPDQPWEAGRPGKHDCYGASLHRLAGLTITEPDDSRLMVRHWQPRPAFDQPPGEVGRAQPAQQVTRSTAETAASHQPVSPKSRRQLKKS